MMSEAVADAIAARVVEKLDERRRLTQEQHTRHHEFVEQLILRNEAWTELLHDLRKHLARWGAVGLLSITFYALWQYFRQQVAGQ